MSEKRRWWRDDSGVHEEIARFDDDGALIETRNPAGDPQPGVDDPFDWPFVEGRIAITADDFYAGAAQARADSQAAIDAARQARVDALIAAGLSEEAARLFVGGPP